MYRKKTVTLLVLATLHTLIATIPSSSNDRLLRIERLPSTLKREDIHIVKFADLDHFEHESVDEVVESVDKRNIINNETDRRHSKRVVVIPSLSDVSGDDGGEVEEEEVEDDEECQDVTYNSTFPPPLNFQIRYAPLSISTRGISRTCPIPTSGWKHGGKTIFVSPQLFSTSLCGEKAVVITSAGNTTGTIVGKWIGKSNGSNLKAIKISKPMWYKLNGPTLGRWYFQNSTLEQKALDLFKPKPTTTFTASSATSILSTIETAKVKALAKTGAHEHHKGPDYFTEDDTTTASPQVSASTTNSSVLPSATSTRKTFTGGFATYFYQQGNAGACGKKNLDSSTVVALDYRRYGNLDSISSRCFQQVSITRVSTGKTIVATIADACPTCTNSNSLDLSVGAFTQLATKEEGMVEITWSFL